MAASGQGTERIPYIRVAYFVGFLFPGRAGGEFRRRGLVSAEHRDASRDAMLAERAIRGVRTIALGLEHAAGKSEPDGVAIRALNGRGDAIRCRLGDRDPALLEVRGASGQL